MNKNERKTMNTKTETEMVKQTRLIGCHTRFSWLEQVLHELLVSVCLGLEHSAHQDAIWKFQSFRFHFLGLLRQNMYKTLWQNVTQHVRKFKIIIESKQIYFAKNWKETCEMKCVYLFSRALNDLFIQTGEACNVHAMTLWASTYFTNANENCIIITNLLKWRNIMKIWTLYNDSDVKIKKSTGGELV